VNFAGAAFSTFAFSASALPPRFSEIFDMAVAPVVRFQMNNNASALALYMEQPYQYDSRAALQSEEDCASNVSYPNTLIDPFYSIVAP
jgi:hypothetical protein